MGLVHLWRRTPSGDLQERALVTLGVLGASHRNRIPFIPRDTRGTASIPIIFLEKSQQTKKNRFDLEIQISRWKIFQKKKQEHSDVIKLLFC